MKGWTAVKITAIGDCRDAFGKMLEKRKRMRYTTVVMSVFVRKHPLLQ